MALLDGPLRQLSLDGLLMNGLPMNGLLMKALTMKNHRLAIAALCLMPLLAACELVVDFDRTKIVPAGDSGADMSASDMNTGTDMPPADMPGADMSVEDMDIPDMPGADLNVADLGVADLGVADLGVADLGAVDLGAMDAGPACPICNDSNPCTDDSCVVATGVCAFTAQDCSGMNGICVVGMCNMTTGVCEPMDRPDGTMCMTTMMCMTGVCI